MSNTTDDQNSFNLLYNCFETVTSTRLPRKHYRRRVSFQYTVSMHGCRHIHHRSILRCAIRGYAKYCHTHLRDTGHTNPPTMDTEWPHLIIHMLKLCCFQTHNSLLHLTLYTSFSQFLHQITSTRRGRTENFPNWLVLESDSVQCLQYISVFLRWDKTALTLFFWRIHSF